MEQLSSDDIDARRRALREAILSGPRSASAFPLVDADGELIGPFGLMVRFPVLGAPLQELGAALRFRTCLSARQREIVILVVAREMRSSFESYAHTAIGREVGLTEAEINALLRGEFWSEEPVESDMAAIAAAFLSGNIPVVPSIDDETMAEIITIVGYYRLLAQLMSNFGVEAPQSPVITY